MIQITDEILNKYLDSELNREQTEQVKSAIRNSEELQRKFNALKLVHDNLSIIKEDEVSPGFTEKLMKTNCEAINLLFQNSRNTSSLQLQHL